MGLEPTFTSFAGCPVTIPGTTPFLNLVDQGGIVSPITAFPSFEGQTSGASPYLENRGGTAPLAHGLKAHWQPCQPLRSRSLTSWSRAWFCPTFEGATPSTMLYPTKLLNTRFAWGRKVLWDFETHMTEPPPFRASPRRFALNYRPCVSYLGSWISVPGGTSILYWWTR